MVNSTLFTFARISPLNTLPLITRLVTSPANSDINGTEVICQDRVTRNSSSTIIIVINERLIPGRFCGILWSVCTYCDPSLLPPILSPLANLVLIQKYSMGVAE